MPLSETQREIALNGGMNLKESTELAPETSLRAVTNLRWDAQGELRKRPTYASSAAINATPSATYTNDNALTLFTRENEVCALTHDFGVVRVDPEDHNGTALFVDAMRTINTPRDATLKYAPRGCRVSRQFIESSQDGLITRGIFQASSAVYDGTLVVAWIDIGSASSNLLVCAKAIDIASGVVVARMQTQTVTVSYTDICAVPYYEVGKLGVLITYSSGGAAPFTINSVRYVASSREFVTDSALATDARNSQHSLATDQANGRVYLGYTSNAGAFPLLVKRGTIAQIAGGSSTVHTATHTASHSTILVGPTRTLIASNSTSAFAEVFGTPASVITLFSAAVSETLLGVTAALESNPTSTHRGVLYFGGYGVGTPATNRVYGVVVDFTNTTPVEGLNTLIPNAWVAAAAFTFDGRAYCTFSLDPRVGVPTSLIVARYAESIVGSNLTRHEPIARLCHDRFYAPDGGVLSGAVSTSVVGSKVYLVLPADPNPTPYAGFYLAQSMFMGVVDFGVPVPSLEVDGTALLSSGICVEYDGDTTSEHAPIGRPRVYATNVATPGTLLADVASISAIAIWRWVDKKGRLHRSAPSNVSASGDVGAAPAATHRIDIYVTAPAFAGFGLVSHYIEPELYVTADGGSTFYLAHGRVAAPDAKLDWTGYDARSTMWVYEDVHPGSASMPQPYTTGAGGEEIAAEAPPAFLHMARIGDRLWGIDAEDRTRLWFTKPLVAGFAPEWATVNTLTIGDNGVAVVSLGGAVAVLCERGIWQIYGSGPDALGNGAAFPPAVRIASECSCIDPIAVCRTPLGVVFRGRRGFYAINDGGQLSAFDVPVDPATRAPSLADYSYCRVLFDEVAGEIRVIDAHSERYFVFHLGEQKWSEWWQDTAQQNVIDAVTCDGRVWYLHYDDETSIRREYGLDETQDVSRSEEDWSIETPKIRVDSVMGRGRLWKLYLALKVRAGGVVSDTVAQVAALTVALETFGAGSDGTETFVWTGAQLAAMGDDDGDVLQLEMRPRNQRCKAFKVTVTESCDFSDNYSGSSPVALRLVMGVDGKPMRHVHSNGLKGPA